MPFDSWSYLGDQRKYRSQFGELSRTCTERGIGDTRSRRRSCQGYYNVRYLLRRAEWQGASEILAGCPGEPGEPNTTMRNTTVCGGQMTRARVRARNLPRLACLLVQTSPDLPASDASRLTARYPGPRLIRLLPQFSQVAAFLVSSPG